MKFSVLSSQFSDQPGRNAGFAEDWELRTDNW